MGQVANLRGELKKIALERRAASTRIFSDEVGVKKKKKVKKREERGRCGEFHNPFSDTNRVTLTYIVAAGGGDLLTNSKEGGQGASVLSWGGSSPFSKGKNVEGPGGQKASLWCAKKRLQRCFVVGRKRVPGGGMVRYFC